MLLRVRANACACYVHMCACACPCACACYPLRNSVTSQVPHWMSGGNSVTNNLYNISYVMNILIVINMKDFRREIPSIGYCNTGIF